MSIRTSGVGNLLVTALATLVLAGCVTAGPIAELSASSSSAAGGHVWQEQLDDAWVLVESRFPDAARPPVQMDRYVHPSEWASLVVNCLHELGYTAARASPDGGVQSGSLEPSQAEPHALALYQCTGRYPIDPVYFESTDAQSVNALYDYFTDVVVDCLAAQGFTVSPAPSRERFLETFGTNEQWDLYGEVAAQVGSQERWYEVNEQCPQRPPSS